MAAPLTKGAPVTVNSATAASSFSAPDWLSPAAVRQLVASDTVMPPSLTSCTVSAEVKRAGGEMTMAMLGMDMALNMMLPCRVSVWEQDGQTRVGMVPPTELLGLVSQDPRVADAAREVEAAMLRMIDAVV